MKYRYLSWLFFLACPLWMTAQTRGLTQYVDPLSQEDARSQRALVAALPQGTICVGPELVAETGHAQRTDAPSEVDTLTGFTHRYRTTEGTVCPSGVKLLPMYSDSNGNGARLASFHHDSEELRPGYYRVLLDRWKIRAEMTTTERVALYRFTFPRGSNNALVSIDLGMALQDAELQCRMKQEDLFTLVGYRMDSKSPDKRKMYFVVQFDRPIHRWMSTGANSPFGIATFEVRADEAVQAKVFLSPLGETVAQQTLARELTTWDFDEVCRRADEAWEQELGQTTSVGTTDDELTAHYTRLYSDRVSPWTTVVAPAKKNKKRKHNL